MESLKNFRNGRIFKWGKAFLVYFTIFFFTQWLQMIGIALLFPWGGGEFHVLLQLDDSESFN